MEINAANVAWHKNFFVGSQVGVDKKMDEKKPIGELSTEEMHEITDNAIPATTKRT